MPYSPSTVLDSLAFRQGRRAEEKRTNKTVQQAVSVVIAGFLGACLVLGATANRGDAALSIGLQWSGTYQESESPAEMDVIQRSGAELFRIPISKTTFDVYGWKPFDTAFDYAAQRGISILPYLYGRAGDGARFPTAAEYGSWGEWVTQVVERYGVGGYFWAGKPYARPATIWEVWNEPNLAANNPKLTKAQCEAIPSPYNATAETCAQPRNYGKFLTFTASTIRSRPEGANAMVLFGGLYGYAAPQAFNFLEDAHEEAGVLAAYNGLAFHPYAFSPNHIEVFTSLINTARASLNTLGGSAKSIWITEMGWQVEYAHEGWGPVNLDEQAVLLHEAFTWLKTNSATKNIQSAIWSSYHDHPANIPNWAYHSGLRDLSGNFRPSWWAFQEQTGVPRWPASLDSHPVPLGDPSSEAAIYYQGADGGVWELYRDPNTGWSGPNRFANTQMAPGTSPTIGRNPTTGAAWIYYQGADGGIWELYRNPSTGWTGPTRFAGTQAAPGTSPAVVGDPSSGVAAVYYQGADGGVWELYRNPSTGWTGPNRFANTDMR
jgi:hypothetical protein